MKNAYFKVIMHINIVDSASSKIIKIEGSPCFFGFLFLKYVIQQ